MAERKKFSIVKFILAFLLVVVIFKGTTYFIKSDENKSYFYKEKKSSGEQLYNEIMGLSEINLPKTPEDLLELYFNSFRLVYGNYIKDETIIPQIVEKQRLLFSSEINELNNEGFQNQFIKNGIDFFKKEKYKVTDISYDKIEYYDYYSTKAVVEVTKVINFKNPFNFKYYLSKNKVGNWSISGFKHIKEQEI